MKLAIVMPERVVLECDGIVALRAEDASGCFGVLRGHADLVARLIPSVVTWRRDDGTPHYCAVRGGTLLVEHGSRVTIATPEAVPGADLATLESDVLARLRQVAQVEAAAAADLSGLRLRLLRQAGRTLRPHETATRWTTQ